MSGDLHAVVLAAGLGRRFGGGKLLASYGAGVLIEGALAAAFAAPVASVVVVTGAQAQAVEAVVEAFAEARGERGRLHLVRAGRHAEGMAWSLRAGIEALPTNAAGAFLFLGDMPRVSPLVLALLARALADGAPAAAPVFEATRGHPVLVSSALFPELLSLTGDAGAKGVLDRLGERLARVASPDDGVLFDVDTREALDAATISHRAG